MAIINPNTSDDAHSTASDFHFPTSKSALIIFTRNPELGKVKTRLAKTIGDENALEIYKFLLKHTAEITKNLNVDKFVFYSENINRNDLWNPDIFRKKLQFGNELGERMKNAFSDVFSMGYESVIIIGSDMFDMDTQDLKTAFVSLQTSPYVIGPASDGGYYLLGMKQLNTKVFENKVWGTDSVLKSTLNDLRQFKYTLLDEKNDIDYYEDIKDVKAFQQFLPPHLDSNFI
ncbi:TIGR04282 family arsenosugar biosynthesis glycosyltransferase [Aequorivita xiaoshiensis]|uniref:TIGR04282 family arsenosugar biosynthesis glycosyltransferase n=1 Tax=Aequorivita xiaoshiensis TaxID=2874476 RepID=A0A9X1R484_9FLAO|nr:TIGR04282 family arsenosugar biosynthesis glycosyltransferase [Aequorivita xiaoshiensis]MCG2431467.1 TIGR04282 family arsenosugar biosynthesis glycosyltransferase [Aequorivita xiaoshiensis]